MIPDDVLAKRWPAWLYQCTMEYFETPNFHSRATIQTVKFDVFIRPNKHSQMRYPWHFIWPENWSHSGGTSFLPLCIFSFPWKKGSAFGPRNRTAMGEIGRGWILGWEGSSFRQFFRVTPRLGVRRGLRRRGCRRQVDFSGSVTTRLSGMKHIVQDKIHPNAKSNQWGGILS